MESAAPGTKTVSTGWLNRYLQTAPDPHATPLRAAAIGEQLPKALRGPAAALNIGRLDEFNLAGGAMLSVDVRQRIERAADWRGTRNVQRHRPAEECRSQEIRAGPGVNYGRLNDSFGQALRQIAQLIKAEVGLQIAFVDVRGEWDTHQSQPSDSPRCCSRLVAASPRSTRSW